MVFDEFIELLNFSDETMDISGWSISDAVSTRHVFPENTILSAHEFIVIFGGGDPQLSEVNWQVATSGSLSFNNSGDTITLLDADLSTIDQIIYGNIGGNDQSIAKFPEEPNSDFVLHATIEEANGALFSPGFGFSSDSLATTTVPEPFTWLSFSLGSMFLIRRKRKK